MYIYTLRIGLGWAGPSLAYHWAGPRGAHIYPAFGSLIELNRETIPTVLTGLIVLFLLAMYLHKNIAQMRLQVRKLNRTEVLKRLASANKSWFAFIRSKEDVAVKVVF